MNRDRSHNARSGFPLGREWGRLCALRNLILFFNAYKVLEMPDLSADTVRVLQLNYPDHPGIYDIRDVVVED